MECYRFTGAGQISGWSYALGCTAAQKAAEEDIGPSQAGCASPDFLKFPTVFVLVTCIRIAGANRANPDAI